MSDISMVRTDLALEAREVWDEGARDGDELPGVISRERSRRGFPVTEVEIVDQRGADALCKPIGKYITLELDKLLRREEDSFADCAQVLSEILCETLESVPSGAPVLVAGLGNEQITPDAVGPWAADHILVTRHLKEKSPLEFAAFRPVAALRAGVLGTTGIESAALVALAAREIGAQAVVAVDSLASRSLYRLCRTVQITDTGIVPGSGVGNARCALTRASLGIPVVAVGVPTVVEAATLARELSGADCPGEAGSMIVTPRDIDRSARDAAKLTGYGINLALQRGLTVADLDMLLS